MGSLRGLRLAAGETRAGKGVGGKPARPLWVEEACSLLRHGSCSFHYAFPSGSSESNRRVVIGGESKG